MRVINFTHPLTSAHLAAIEQLSGQTVDRVIEVKTQFDPGRPFVEQARALVESIALSPQEWQTMPLLMNLPSLGVIAALVLAEVHGRCGYFPAMLRLKPLPEITPPRFEVAEIVNL